MMWLSILGLIIGILVGFLVPVKVPAAYAKYLSVAVLAALDSVFGGVRAHMENQFDSAILLSGFFFNILMAAFLAYIGDQLGVELYLAAVLVFGSRLFQNLAIIRRHLLKR